MLELLQRANDVPAVQILVRVKRRIGLVSIHIIHQLGSSILSMRRRGLSDLECLSALVVSVFVLKHNLFRNDINAFRCLFGAFDGCKAHLICYSYFLLRSPDLVVVTFIDIVDS